MNEIHPYDLHPPEKILYPRFGKPEVTEIALGYPKDAVIRRSNWNGHITIQVVVPCDSIPHCHYCECGSEHLITLTEEQRRKLKEIM